MAALAGCGSGGEDNNNQSLGGNTTLPGPFGSYTPPTASPTPTPSAGATPDPTAYSGTFARATPQMAAILTQFLNPPIPPLYTVTPVEARTRRSVQDAAKEVYMQQTGTAYTPEAVGRVENRLIPGAAGQVMARIYTPAGTGPFPITVYYHGGGWVIATIDTYDSSCRALCNAAQSVIVSVEYRKGPENRFPAAHEDAYAALQYVAQNPGMFGGDTVGTPRIATAGESAGGNLASAVCMMARDRGGFMPRYQALVYPIANTDLTTPSYNENANAVPLSRPATQYFLQNYLNGTADYSNPLIALLNGNVNGLPPATVITDEIDPLRSEGQAYANKLQAAGITVRQRNFTGVSHEFFGLTFLLPEARDAVAYAAQGLRSAF